MNVKELRPVDQSVGDWGPVEKELLRILREHIYLPLLVELGIPKSTLTNQTESPTIEAIRYGRIDFNRGTFSGRFNAAISKELKALGARWEARTGTFKLPLSALPFEFRATIEASESRFARKLDAIDRKLAQVLPEEIAGKVQVAKYFDRSIWRIEKSLRDTLKGITVVPELTAAQRQLMSDDWEKNLKLYITKFTQTQTRSLRKEVKAAVFAGDRAASLESMIKRSYGVSASKARFLARQETALATSTFIESRYRDAGVKEYKWVAVAGSAKHPVRHRHQELAKQSEGGKIFRWDNPPITTEPGEPVRRNNPKQDYNCRCYAKPVVRFKT